MCVDFFDKYEDCRHLSEPVKKECVLKCGRRLVTLAQKPAPGKCAKCHANELFRTTKDVPTEHDFQGVRNPEMMETEEGWIHISKRTPIKDSPFWMKS
jgi:hypothetical protein